MKITLNIILVLILLLASVSTVAQQFTELEAELPGFKNANLHWGDFDNDNDLDLLVAGRMKVNEDSIIPATIIFENQGNDSFVPLDAGITGVYNGYSTWGDFDNDNDLDVLVTGKTTETGLITITEVFGNEGSGSFTLLASLDSLQNGYADWGDVNNDGLLDILLTGDRYVDATTYEPHTYLYMNTGEGAFATPDTSIAAISYGSCDMADYDNDGDMDIFIAGVGSQEILAEIYKNDSGFFSPTGQSIEGFTKGTCAWADYDNDGDYDLLVSGAEGGVASSATALYRNVDNNFSLVTLQGADTLPPLSFPSVDWGDFDNDGDLDILLTGQIGLAATRYSGIFRNDNNDVFTQVAGVLPPVRTGDARWGDYDNDGDLDIAICGTDTTGVFGEYILKIFRNELINQENEPPSIPSGLFAVVDEGEIHFYWEASTDDWTPDNALSYNIMIGTESMKYNLVTPMTDAESGFRIIPHHGNAAMNTFYTLENAGLEKYYWSVQAIDGAYAGSSFSEESILDLNTVGLNELSESAEHNLYVYPNPSRGQSTIEWTATAAGTLKLQVCNITNQEVFRIRLQVKKGINRYILNTRGWEPGFYFIVARSATSTKTARLLVIN